MMNTVRKSVRPVSIWFDGISWVPSACLKKWKTMAILVKDVIMTSAAGTNVRSVRRRTIWSGAETAPRPLTLTVIWQAEKAQGRGASGGSRPERARHDFFEGYGRLEFGDERDGIGRQADEQAPALDRDDRERAALAKGERGLDRHRAADALGRRAPAQEPGEPDEERQHDQERGGPTPVRRDQVGPRHVDVGQRQELSHPAVSSA